MSRGGAGGLDDATLMPSPGVRFGPDLLPRLARLGARLAAARERGEGAGKAWLLGHGEELVGFRPYRPGEDLRRLDWNLLARLGKPFVRVSRREAAEDWAILLDTSASMAVGHPGKLQSAAEVAAGIAAVGLRQGARVRLVTASGNAPSARPLTRGADLMGWLGFLEGLRAGGDVGLAGLMDPSRVRSAGRVFLLGDLCDLEPEDTLRLARRGRTLFIGQVLAQEELDPAVGGAVEWVDPESGSRREVQLDASVRAAYESLIEERLERWRGLSGRHRMGFVVWSSRAAFEEPARELLAP